MGVIEDQKYRSIRRVSATEKNQDRAFQRKIQLGIDYKIPGWWSKETIFCLRTPIVSNDRSEFQSLAKSI
jgi:hypothetical protein